MLKNDDPAYNAKKSREWRGRTKRMVFDHYGNGNPECVYCGEHDLAKLTIGHINDNGQEERKITGAGSHFYSWLKQNGFPDNGYEIACFSCNLGKRINNNRVREPVIYKLKTNILNMNFKMFLGKL